MSLSLRIQLPTVIRCTSGCSLFRRSLSTKTIRFDHEKLVHSTTITDETRKPISVAHQILRLPMVYSRLCKAKLSGLVVCTTLAGYLIAPSPIFSGTTLVSTLFGTALCAGAANAWNQWAESNHDSKMMRTRLRPLPTRQISSFHAFGWAAACATVGLSTLWVGSGPVACGIAASTIALYTLVYTPMKRYSVLNTWVGAIVGGLPPLIGYAGAVSQLGLPALVPDALLLGAVLYCWQFPHFNALSHNLRQDYARAGYCMAATMRPALNQTAAVVHAAVLIPLTMAFTPLGTGLTDYWFLLDGGIAAMGFTWLGARFYSNPGKSSAKRLFFGSLIYLPLFLVLLFIHKQ